MQDIREEKNAISALRMLQKERLVVSRLGFPDRAFELDREIELMMKKASDARKEEEENMLAYRMKGLAMAHKRKQQRLEFILEEETKQMNGQFQLEEAKCLKRQETEFLRVLESATRRAVGRVKKCNCEHSYTCRHNKTASYNTRRPSHVVVQYRRNAKRLKHAGRPEEANAWLEKANALDEREQERWRVRVADSIVSSPWGANEAAVDQVTELHKRELGVLRKTHAVKRDMHEKKQAMRRKNFRNTMLAEERKVRMQCRKQALLRIHKDYAKELKEERERHAIEGKSAGLSHVSKNLVGESFDETEKAAVDWVPPSTAGLENSVRLFDAAEEIGGVDASEGGRIMTSFQDMQTMDAQQIRDRIQENLTGKDDDSEQDSESEEEEEEEKEEEEDDESKSASESKSGTSQGTYTFGTTSGSKLVDKMRKINQRKMKKQAMATANAELKANKEGEGLGGGFTPGSSAPTATGGWTGGGLGGGSGNPFGAPAASGNPFGAPAASGNPFGAPAASGNPFGAPAAGGNPFGAPSTAEASELPGPAPASSPVPSGNTNNNNNALGGSSALGGLAGGVNPLTQSPASTTTTAPTFGAPTANLNSSFAQASTATSGNNPFGGSSSGFGAAPPPSTPVPSAPSFRAGMHITVTSTAATGATGTGEEKEGGSTSLHPAAADEHGEQQPMDDNVVAELTKDPSRSGSGSASVDDSMSAENGGAGGGDPSRSKSEEPVGAGGGGDDEEKPITEPHTKLKMRIEDIQKRPNDYTFDPETDTQPPSFKPGSVKDEDWQALDDEKAKTVGEENSFGMSLITKDVQPPRSHHHHHHASVSASTSAATSGNTPFSPVNATFGPGHEPPILSSPHAIPTRSALHHEQQPTHTGTSGSAVGSSAKKKVQFGENVLCTFTSLEPEPDPGLDDAEGGGGGGGSGKNEKNMMFPPTSSMVSEYNDSFGSSSAGGKERYPHNRNHSSGYGNQPKASAPANASADSGAPPFGSGAPAASVSNPFSAPAASGSNPFGAPTASGSNPFGAPASSGGNPFTASGVPTHVDATAMGNAAPFPNAQSSGHEIDVNSNTAANRLLSPASPKFVLSSPAAYGYGGNAKDLSVDWADQSSAGDSNTSESKAGPSWELCFSRFLHLDDIFSTLEVILTDDDLYEAAELYVSTFDHHAAAASIEMGGGGRSGNNEPEHVSQEDKDTYATQLTQKMQLLRGWKAFEADNGDTERLVQGMEEVMGVDSNDLDLDNLLLQMDNYNEQLKDIFKEVAEEFVAEFVLSNDFAAHHEGHAEIKSHNKKLRTDSKSWVGKFQKATNNHNCLFHLFAFGGGRPFANKKMKTVFGPMCDAPTPREYIDASTPAEIATSVTESMKSGKDLMNLPVTIRTVRDGKKEAEIFIKHIYSYKVPDQIKFTMVMVVDLNGSHAKHQKKITECIVQSIPNNNQAL
eukprot:CAMPEP_0174967318 /NCGR_PEP_ID=MMETSP0004_2-20121128/7520_1 /TAXON_ID=420556 /ORGANISM="Ochromonas sp., Strain CCMP1393" /LENGTH=1434 /DNA_ID=CAMNT_0016216443 /DNA_START=463 /DNA_END=4767 /DNA_ORIENTATION=+